MSEEIAENRLEISTWDYNSTNVLVCQEAILGSDESSDKTSNGMRGEIITMVTYQSTDCRGGRSLAFPPTSRG
jgi:hypothetical protein